LEQVTAQVPSSDTEAKKGGLHMNNEREAPQWMKNMFYELSVMFEELFPDADRLNLEEMQQKLDEQQANAESRALAPATIYFDGKLRDPQ
jgi:hypothetical protein